MAVATGTENAPFEHDNTDHNVVLIILHLYTNVIEDPVEFLEKCVLNYKLLPWSWEVSMPGPVKSVCNVIYV